jgi:hypothetical protein
MMRLLPRVWKEGQNVGVGDDTGGFVCNSAVSLYWLLKMEVWPWVIKRYYSLNLHVSFYFFIDSKSMNRFERRKKVQKTSETRQKRADQQRKRRATKEKSRRLHHAVVCPPPVVPWCQLCNDQ